MKYFNRKNGITLLELIIALSIAVIVLSMLLNYLAFIYKSSFNRLDYIVHMRNARFALNYIEKRLRELDQVTVSYTNAIKAIEGKNHAGETMWIDLSGYVRNRAYIYFNKPTKQLRVNKHGEHNVLVSFIGNVEIREIGNSNLIEIEVFSSEVDYSVKGRFHITTIKR